MFRLLFVSLLAVVIPSKVEGEEEITFGDPVPCNPPMDKVIEMMREKAKNPVDPGLMFCEPILLYGLPFCKRAGDVTKQEIFGDDDQCHVQSLDVIFNQFNYTCAVNMEMFLAFASAGGFPIPPAPPAPAIGGAMKEEKAEIVGCWNNVHLKGRSRICKKNKENSQYSDVQPVDDDPGDMSVGCRGSNLALKALCADNAFLDYLKKGIGTMVQEICGKEIAEIFLSSGDVYDNLTCD